MAGAYEFSTALQGSCVYAIRAADARPYYPNSLARIAYTHDPSRIARDFRKIA